MFLGSLKTNEILRDLQWQSIQQSAFPSYRQIGKMLNAREPKIVNGPQILDKYVGESEANVRKLFEDAEKEEKAVSLILPHWGSHVCMTVTWPVHHVTCCLAETLSQHPNMHTKHVVHFVILLYFALDFWPQTVLFFTKTWGKVYNCMQECLIYQKSCHPTSVIHMYHHYLYC